MYTPLKILNCLKIEQKDNNINTLVSFINSNFNKNIDYVTDEEALQIVLNPFFLTNKYSKKIGIRNDLHSSIIDPNILPHVIDLLCRALGCNTLSIHDATDAFCIGAIENIWAQNKQVYKMDNDFSVLLIETEKTIIYEDILAHLPYNTFYMDLVDLEIPYLEGQFVHVHKYAERGYFITTIMVSSDLFTFTHFWNIWFDSDADDYCIIDNPINKRNYNPVGIMVSEHEVELVKGKEDRNAEMSKHRDDCAALALNFLMYLGSSKPDIQENEISKMTYRPGPTIKNTFKEVRTWDVGVRYGNSFKVAKELFEKECNDEKNILLSESKKGTPKRPHMRCAHWHHYRVGKGKSEIILKWLPPIFVLGSGKEIPITIHNVE